MRADRLASAALFVTACLAAGCRDADSAETVPMVPDGDPVRGRIVMRRVGCGGCHVIPGLSGAQGLVGPPLTAFAERTYIAGHLVNEPENLVLWLMDPQAIEPSTAMPDLSLTEAQARDVAAHLYTLRGGGGLGPPRLFPARWLREIPGLGEH